MGKIIYCYDGLHHRKNSRVILYLLTDTTKMIFKKIVAFISISAILVGRTNT